MTRVAARGALVVGRGGGGGRGRLGLVGCRRGAAAPRKPSCGLTVARLGGAHQYRRDNHGWVHPRRHQRGALRWERRHVVTCGAARSAETEKARELFVNDEIARLDDLIEGLAGVDNPRGRIEYLHTAISAADWDTCIDSVASTRRFWIDESSEYLLLLLVAIGQAHVLGAAVNEGKDFVSQLLSHLSAMEQFYDSVGGVIGYQVEMLKLIQEHTVARNRSMAGGDEEEEDLPLKFHPPPGVKLAGGSDSIDVEARKAIIRGIASVPRMAEIYPMGGAADRLGLIDPATGEPLPAAMLPYCGRNLLECLIRDLYAREYLHFKVHGRQHVTPVAIMTSDVKNAHGHIMAACTESSWFGRGMETFRLFRQPLVPVAETATGRWLLSDTFGDGAEIVMKPGGHGALWKLSYDEGVLDWLQHSASREAAFVRQVSNPLAGTDATLLTLGGVGVGDGKSEIKRLGFATCPRTVGASEGLNVLTERKLPNGTSEYGIGCVEYTEFERLAPELIRAGDIDAFPSNTNVLFVNLNSVESLVNGKGEAARPPGLIMNMKKTVSYTEYPSKEEVSVKAGRLECTMQAIADAFVEERETFPDNDAQELRTFAIYNSRRHVTSSAKRKRSKSIASIAQTPDGSFRDLMLNSRDLLDQCGITAEPIGSVEEYLDIGPSFIFLFHPALGPLWEVISQKLRGGGLVGRSEFVLEVAEADIEDIQVDGSLRIEAENVLGSAGRGDERIVFGEKQARVQLRNVSVCNEGVDWDCTNNVYWEHRVARKESCRVILEGNSAFTARDVSFTGDRTFTVPDGYHMIISRRVDLDMHTSANPNGDLLTSEDFTIKLERISAEEPLWRWEYAVQEDSTIALNFVEAGTKPPVEEINQIPVLSVTKK